MKFFHTSKLKFLQPRKPTLEKYNFFFSAFLYSYVAKLSGNERVCVVHTFLTFFIHFAETIKRHFQNLEKKAFFRQISFERGYALKTYTLNGQLVLGTNTLILKYIFEN